MVWQRLGWKIRDFFGGFICEGWNGRSARDYSLRCWIMEKADD
jgi:hypothetical protein